MNRCNEPLALAALATIGLLAWVLLLAYQQNADLSTKLVQQQADALRQQASVCQNTKNNQAHKLMCTMIKRQYTRAQDQH